MSDLSDYLMKHHFDVMADETIGDIQSAALEVIKAQDAALKSARHTISIAEQTIRNISRAFPVDHDYKQIALNESQNLANWLLSYPTPPAQPGGK